MTTTQFLDIQTLQQQVTELQQRVAQLEAEGADLRARLAEAQHETAILRESDRRYRTLVEQLPVCTYVAVLDGFTTSVYDSPQIETLTGFAAAEWIGTQLWVKQLHPEDRDRVLAQNVRSQTTGEPFVADYRLLTRDGRVIWVHDEARVVPGDETHPTVLQGIWQDITERKQTEAALREAEARYRALVEGFPSVIHYIVQPNESTPHLYISPQVENLLGFSQSEGTTIPDLWLRHIHPDDRESDSEIRRTCFTLGLPYSSEYRLFARDGHIVWLHDEAIPIRDSAGQIVTYRGIMLDITARKQAEIDLHERINQLRALYHSSDSLAHAPTLEDVYEEALNAIQLALKADRASILLFDDDDVSRFKAWRGLSEDYRRSVQGHSPWPRNALAPQPIFMPTVSEKSLGDLYDAIWNEGIRAIGFIPLVGRDGLLGKFVIYFNAPRDFTDDEVQLAKTIASHIAFALERKQAEEHKRQDVVRTQALADLSRALDAAHLDYQKVLDTVTWRMAHLIGDACVICLLSDDQEWLNPVAFYHPNPEAAEFIRTLLPGKPFRLNQGPASQVATTGQPVLIPVVLQDEFRAALQPEHLSYLDRFGIHSLLIVPLQGQGRVIGTLGLTRDRLGQPYTLHDQMFLQNLANRAALAILNARLFEALQVEQEQLEALSYRLVNVQEAERRTIARELHDEVGQILTGIRLLLDMALRSPDSASANLVEAQALVAELIGQVQNLSLDLRPTMLDDLGLLPALLWYFDRFNTRTGIRVSFTHSDIQRRFKAEAETATYRLIQEALTNVIRHAGVLEVAVEVKGFADRLWVQVSDNGAGFDPAVVLADRNAIGLSSMRERATLLGGRLLIESASGQGTRLIAEIPA